MPLLTTQTPPAKPHLTDAYATRIAPLYTLQDLNEVQAHVLLKRWWKQQSDAGVLPKIKRGAEPQHHLPPDLFLEVTGGMFISSVHVPVTKYEWNDHQHYCQGTH